MSLTARTILITGASRGLGLEFVTQILKLPTAPEILVATCRNPEKASALQELAKANSNLRIVKMDVQNPQDIDAAYQETASLLGDRGLNLLINNAGVNNDTKVGTDLRHVDRDNLNRHFDINCAGPVMISQKFLPLVEKAADKNTKILSCSQASIVMMSTIMASQERTLQNGYGVTLVYKCSKAAMNMASILLSRELGPLGILVFGLHPGWAQTDMGGSAAPVTPQESISGLLNVLANAGSDLQGRTQAWNGEILPF